MRARPLAAVVLLAGLGLVTPSGAAGRTGGQYEVDVLPEPALLVSPYGGCQPSAGAAVVGQAVGVEARQVALPRAGTLRADLVEELDAFVGDVGLRWSLRVYDTAGHELARSTGPAYRTDVSWRARRASRVWLVACNTNGHPHATVTYSFR